MINHGVLQRAIFSYVRQSDRTALICSVVSMLFAFAGCTVLFAGVREMGFITLGFALIAWFCCWVLRQRLYGEALLVLMFLVSYVISWGVGFLGYRYLLFDRAVSLGLPTNHTVMTALLVLVGIVSTISGALGVLVFFPRNAWDHPIAGRRKKLLRMLLVFAVIYVLFQAIYLHVLGFNARWEVGNSNEVGSGSYLVAGLKLIAYPFYALLGLSLKPRLACVWNIAVAMIIAAIVGTLALTGGRSAALEPIIVVFVGATFSMLPWRHVFLLVIASVPLVFFLVIIVGNVRDAAQFNRGGIEEKVSAITTIAKEGRNKGDQYDSPLFVIFSRLYEPSAQTVIDKVTETGNYVGFINVDRLLFVFVPQFAYPEKKPLDDSNERLVEYGYIATDHTSTPLTLLADSYERFGVVGVAFFHVLAGALLCCAGILILRIRERILALILLICCARAALLMYPVSSLGFFHMLLYALMRDIVVISSLYGGGFFLIKCLSGNLRFNSRSVQTMPVA